MDELRRLIDSMSRSKLNLLLLRLAGPSSFRLSAGPQSEEMALASGAEEGETYSAADIGELAEFARRRGVRKLPDLGLAGPAGPGWELLQEKEDGDALLEFPVGMRRCLGKRMVSNLEYVFFKQHI